MDSFHYPVHSDSHNDRQLRIYFGEPRNNCEYTTVNSEVQLSMLNVESLSKVTITVSKNGFTPSEAETTIPPAEFGINILSIETAAITAVTIAIVVVIVVMRKRRA